HAHMNPVISIVLVKAWRSLDRRGWRGLQTQNSPALCEHLEKYNKSSFTDYIQ
ncbi:unnamed protein product, partial [Danaus chrysippus]